MRENSGFVVSELVVGSVSKIHNIKAHIGVFSCFFLVFIKKVSSRRRVFRFDGFSNGFDSEGRPFYGVFKPNSGGQKCQDK